jgi:hypothetical protein
MTSLGGRAINAPCPASIHGFFISRSGSTMSKQSVFGSLGLFAVILVAASGCSGGSSSGRTAHLQGSVTVGGKPIPPQAEASITIRPTGINQANASYAKIIDGRFDMPDAPKGKVMVSFSIQNPTGKMIKYDEFSRPEPELISLAPQSWKDGQEMQVDGDKSDMVFDLK